MEPVECTTAWHGKRAADIQHIGLQADDHKQKRRDTTSLVELPVMVAEIVQDCKKDLMAFGIDRGFASDGLKEEKEWVQQKRMF